MRRLPGFTPPSAGELVAPAAAPYMKLARRRGRKSLARPQKAAKVVRRAARTPAARALNDRA